MGFLIVFLLLISPEGRAQQDTVMKPGTDTAYIRKIARMADQNKDPDSSIQIYNEALKRSIAGNFHNGIIYSRNRIGALYFIKNDPAKAIGAFKMSLPYCRSAAERAETYNTIGDLYDRGGDFVNAAQSFYKGLDALQQSHATGHDAAMAYISLFQALFILNTEINNDSAAIFFLNQAEIAARNEKANYALSFILLNKSAYIREKKPDSSLLLLNETRSLCRSNNFKDREAEIDIELGRRSGDLGEYLKSIDYYKAAIALSADPKLETRRGYISTYCSWQIARDLCFLGKFKEAESILTPVVKKAEQSHTMESITFEYETLMHIYDTTGQYKKAYECAMKLMVLKDTLTSTEKAREINIIQAKYKTTEKDRLLTQNQLLIAEQKNKIAHKDIWMISIGSGFLLLLLISTGVYMQTRNRQRSHEKENKIGVLKAAVEGGDNERTRIARELHDGIGGMLSAAMMRFSSMHHENPDIAETAAYKDTMGILREMGDEIRKTAHNLMPEVLLKQSLPEAVRIYCSNVREEGTLEIDFQSYGSFDALSQGHKLNLYRITQELVKNASLHSDASKVLVQLLQNEDKLIVSVEDNGKGFEADEIKAGLGLHNVRTRVSSMDGHFTLESMPGKGTTVIVELENPIVTPATQEMS